VIPTPNDYNPTAGVPSYLESDEDCTEPASYFIPFFKDRMGPTYEDYNTNFHEARPGHHLQIQGFLENFGDDCDATSIWINELVDYYPGFSEGWGVYSENPILSNDTNILEREGGIAKYGMLKWQIWRALRLVVDVGMHASNMTRDEALQLFSKFTWDDSDTAKKELTRYQGTPAQATSYMMGQTTLIKLRHQAQEALGDKFNLKEFHYHILSQGQSPFDFIQTYIKQYIECEKSPNPECNKVMHPSRRSSRTRAMRTPQQKLITSINHMFRRRIRL